MHNHTPVRIIAEAGVNHNGCINRALALVDAAVEAGADTVKFQSFQADALAGADAPKAPYQQRTTAPSESQRDMLRALALSAAHQRRLYDHCRQRGIGFLSSPFDLGSARLLCAELGLEEIKLASGEITNGPLLLAVARCAPRIILSTGMSSLEEIEQALAVIAFGYTAERDATPTPNRLQAAYTGANGQAQLRRKLTLLHCTTAYPCPYTDVNLRAMDTLRSTFGLRTGLSDHTAGCAVALAAVARGARVIEKHFTLDRTLPGPDHAASLEPDELARLVTEVRQIEQALGSPDKQITIAETPNRRVARQNLVAVRPIRQGEIFNADNLGTRRAGGHSSPMQYWDVLGRTAARDYQAGEEILL